MRILLLSKACLVGTYQTKLEEMARFDDIELVAIVPPSWNDPSGPLLLERSHTDGYHLLVEPLRFNGHFHLHHYPHLKRRLADFRPDIVHIDEEPYNLATWMAMRQSKAIGAKTLFFSWQNLERRYPFPFNILEKQVLSGVDFAIMGNQESVGVWRRKGYQGKHRVIPQFGVNPERFRPPHRRERGRGFVFGSANRRLVSEKGVDVLIRAAATLPGMWRLHIAGDGPARPSLERLALRLGIRERVQFDGVIGSEDVPSYLRQLDVLVLSSRTLPNWKEQFGRVLIEAMACEVAVVGTRSGEIPNVIGRDGLLFPEDDVDALRAHLLELMQSTTLRDELGHRGRLRVLAQYTQAQIARRTVETYREMLAR